ncbi:MAG TPA: membrane protein insertase YidC [Gammaproteobacteria bacterium]|nr:membrane protein insertase YidC [Gammaproteobacteria bacterium]
MDNRRLFLVAAVAVIAFALYQTWMLDYGPRPEPHATPAAASGAVSGAATPPANTAGAAATANTGGAGAAPPAPAAVAALPKGREVHVRTDVLDLTIDTAGGDICRAALIKYPVTLKDPDQHVRVLDDSPDSLLVQQGGVQVDKGLAVGADAVYTTAQTDYTLAQGSDTLKVALTWDEGDGLTLSKTYTLTRGSYQVRVDYTVQNAGRQPWTGSAWWQWQNNYVAPHTGFFSTTRYDYQRMALRDADGYKQRDFPKVAESPISESVEGGWVAVVEHYFLAAIIPAGQQKNLYYSKSAGAGHFVTGGVSAQKTAAPGASADFSATLYIGPKLQTELATVAPQLELTVDYGKLTVLAQPIFWVLSHIEKFIGNWGWSILILTLLIKAATYKLNEISGRSMAKMRVLAPRLKQLQERYKDDRQKLAQATMELYKKEGANPASGCLPMVIQIPIFFSLYYVLVDSVELRHAPWTLWIHDLSAPDPYYVLPVIYAAAMFIQTHLQPPPQDKTQAMMVKIMPLALAVFYMVLPVGLVLYYLANSIITIAQQRYINKLIEKESKKA